VMAMAGLKLFGKNTLDYIKTIYHGRL
jgi:hypothetical protein